MSLSNMPEKTATGSLHKKEYLAGRNITFCSADQAVPFTGFLSGDGFEYCLFPGFADVHVHLREPGFSCKETIRTGTLAAAHGGYTAVCAMPNLNPAPDGLQTLHPQIELIKKDAVVHVYPYGTITKGEKGDTVADLAALAENVCAFSDDGRGVQSEDVMLQAMTEARRLGKIIAAHCEDDTLLSGGYIHAGKYAALHSHRGISSRSEWCQLERDLNLVARTGCAYHMCHTSTKESVALLRQAKASGLDVTCETAPHYLLLDEQMLKEDGRFKMNPPLRGREDREALLEGLIDGTIDMLATDHAPHTLSQKSRGLAGSAFGITGLECAFSLLYTHLVKKGVCSLEKLVRLMTVGPRERFGLPLEEDDFTVFRLDSECTVDSGTFLSMGRSTPFDGWTVSAKCMMTVCGGAVVWADTQAAEI